MRESMLKYLMCLLLLFGAAPMMTGCGTDFEDFGEALDDLDEDLSDADDFDDFEEAWDDFFDELDD
ncbi:MAG TPA: hypothetical protein VJZ71_13660 [Phycisphaerae bacterium]|nr:hypothetical protein [Phycisphaerae bacterium]